jgi:DNA (cytosine-5)-methyltransferase 1
MIGIDLFSGAGGMSAGFEKAGFEFVLANEIDTQIAYTYQKNHPHTLMLNYDIKYLCEHFDKCILDAYAKNELSCSIDSIKQKLETIDIVIGGPPCQGFSMAGARIRKNGEFDIVNIT